MAGSGFLPDKKRPRSPRRAWPFWFRRGAEVNSAPSVGPGLTGPPAALSPSRRLACA